MGYVALVIENKSRHTDDLFTYQTDRDLAPGTIVKVPFGRGKALKTGYVFRTGVTPAPELAGKIRSVAEVDPDLSMTEEMVETAAWMRQRYGITYVDAVHCFLPPKRGSARGKKKEPYKDAVGEVQEIHRLTEEQQQAVRRIGDAVRKRERKIFLLKGVTGSGKTEVYMQAIRRTLKEGRSVIILVPEIALTDQIIRRLIGRFGKQEIAVLHSRLTLRERYDEWNRLRSGEARIAIGARIGVFAPLPHIGLIIMDEEHESTYKSDQTPKYETVDVAAKRLMAENGVMILGSATPSVVSYQRAKEGIYELIEMNRRYNATPLPEVELVDMREELRAGNNGIFSSRLYQEMQRSLSAGKQIILFLNRRGYATFISCRSCGEAMKCPECGISLVYHKRENALICHYCGKKFPVPRVCPACGSREIRFAGRGTEQIEELVKQAFPDHPSARLDLDTAKNTREIRKLMTSFAKGRTEILIGTQLVAKGLDFRNVGLVGVLAADVSLNIPDYRSAERTFQLVTQVAGRAGRGEEQGRVIVQSYTPDNFALRAAARHDYEAFFREEILIRKLMQYPPFTDLIQVLFTSEEESLAVDTAGRCAAWLEKAKLPNARRILGPKPDPNFKGQNSYRHDILIKCPRGNRNQYIYYLRYFRQKLVEAGTACQITIDVNPYSMV